jgi:hypothetical protein
MYYDKYPVPDLEACHMCPPVIRTMLIADVHLDPGCTSRLGKLVGRLLAKQLLG